jgi:hypothetical protein
MQRLLPITPFWLSVWFRPEAVGHRAEAQLTSKQEFALHSCFKRFTRVDFWLPGDLPVEQLGYLAPVS